MSQRSALNISRMINLAVSEKDASTDVSFINDLNYTIEKLNIKEELPSPFYKPSSLHCIRNMYYQRTSTPIDNSKMSPESVGIAESGTDRHERIQYYVSMMQSVGIDCEWVDVETYIKEHNLEDLEVVSKKDYETKLYNKRYAFRFLADGLIKYHGEYYILEIKTETTNKFIPRTAIDTYHYNQAIAYSLNFGIDKVMFLYENRDVCSKKSYLKIVTDDERNSLIKKLTDCEYCVNNHIVPNKPVDADRKMCQYCQYRTTCRKDR